MRLSTQIEHDLQQVVTTVGVSVGRGDFTLDPGRVSASIGPLLRETPHLLVASFLRVLYQIRPSQLQISRRGPSLFLEAAGPFARGLGVIEQPGRADIEKREAVVALDLLMSLLRGAGYQDCGLIYETDREAWRFTPAEGKVSYAAGGISRFQLWLMQPGKKWRDEWNYLRSISGYCPYSVLFASCSSAGLGPLGAHSDLYLKVSPGYDLDFAFAACTPAMMEVGKGGFQLLGAEEPVAAIRETSHDSGAPTLVRLSAEPGTVGLRFLRQGVLTDPIPLRTRCAARGEVIVKDDGIKTDCTGLRVLDDEISEAHVSEAARRADYGWTTVSLAYHEGKERFSRASGSGFFRSDAGRVLASFIALAIWVGLSIPVLIQPFNAIEPQSLRICLAPLLLISLFGPALAVLMRTLKNLGKYRPGDDPFIWVFHRWDELSR